ncbi:hypothetical protein ASPWEDRAFT_45132 [Aspergillus wentii DTO 134E9]|uniref:BTB domain-containing protein n=1 Tax=Aspergillus wentii DTO 134E9 TaxID=1073089 RepID=A0A1L9R8C1_ASPWE|nr:uncharacterized protein ASPWEDRAFT_45132 [Aspergillus wentii DTO 134E9]KAI9925004.1 hypothetical protein MW887_006411 [Aspergillus wentii]OJJ31172.1 hypothetical protein ASPWEDRAFT_45132 [Aspergillus wentii DTO 134E9]
MHRRHSICQLGLPSVVDSLDDFFGCQEKPRNVDDMYVRRTRSSNPIMPSTRFPQVDGPSERRKAVKRSNKKKKKNKNQSNGEVQESDSVNNANHSDSPPSYSSVAENTGPSKLAGVNASMPLIINGSSWRAGVDNRPDQGQASNDDIFPFEMGAGAFTDFSMAGASSSAAQQPHQMHPNVSQAFASLQHTMQATAPGAPSPNHFQSSRAETFDPSKPPQYLSSNDCVGTQSSAVTFRSPSAVTTEDTIHASSAQSEMAKFAHQPHMSHEGQSHPLYCQVHGRTACHFNHGCCVHRPENCSVCPQKRSCCCIHHAGDCCHCLFSRPPGYPKANDKPQGDMFMPAYPPPPGPVVAGPMQGAPSISNHRPGQYSTSTAEMNRAHGANKQWGTYPEHRAVPIGLNVPPGFNIPQGPIPSQMPPAFAFTDPSNKNTQGNLEHLATHTLGLFENEQFSDFQIVLKSAKGLFFPITFRTHKTLMARSPLINSILKSPAPQEGHSEVTAIAGENFCMFKAFRIVLQNLYGLPVLDTENLRYAAISSLGYTEENIQACPFSINLAVADFALCYAAAGAFFEQSEIVEIGIKIAISFISWENIEMVLYFSLCLWKFAIVSPSDADTEVPSAHDKEPAGAIQGKPDSQASIGELEEVWVPRLVTSAIEFVARHVQPGFKLYTQAQTRDMPDRIPKDLRVPKQPLSNPKLAEVKFGSLESLEEQKPSHEVGIASAILICLPFEKLKEAFAIMGSRQVLTSALAQEIVVERETRRLHALQIYSKQGGEYDDNKISDEIRPLGYREFCTSKGVLSGTREPALMDFSLEREWVGLAVVEITVVHHKKVSQSKK